MVSLLKERKFWEQGVRNGVLCLVFLSLFGLIYWIARPLSFFSEFFGNPFSVFLLTLLVVVSTYRPFDSFVTFLLGKLFYPSRSRRIRNLQEMPPVLMQTLDLKELSNLIVNTVAEVMGQRIVILALWEKSRYSVVSSWGLPVGKLRKIELNPESPLLRFLQEHRISVDRNELMRQLSWPDVYEFSKEFEALGISFLLPVCREGVWVGFLGLSGRLGESDFLSPEEREALGHFASMSAIALKNAAAFEELRQANERLKDLQSKLLQTAKLTAIEQLATGLAHEIHNPLTIISGRAQLLLLKKGKNTDEKMVEEVLKTIVKQTERAADITRKLLMFSEPVSSGRDVIRFENIIDDTLALISYQTALDEITILKNISKDLPPFRGEVNEIREIFLNLILNAIQAVEQKGTVQIKVSYLEREKTIEIRVQDTGKGIRAEHIPQLFNPFFSIREGGLGLGLFITQQIVHRYHGSVHLESEPGVGTLVMVHLPASEDMWQGQPALPDPEQVPVK